MKNLFFLLLLISFQLGFAQEIEIDISPGHDVKNDSTVYHAAGIEVKPEYPGGIEAFYKHIAANFNVPEVKGFNGGKIFINFVVEKDGSLTDIKVIRHPGFGTDIEAIRVLKIQKNGFQHNKMGN
jgi:hypothetical protein